MCNPIWKRTSRPSGGLKDRAPAQGDAKWAGPPPAAGTGRGAVGGSARVPEAAVEPGSFRQGACQGAVGRLRAARQEGAGAGPKPDAESPEAQGFAPRRRRLKPTPDPAGDPQSPEPKTRAGRRPGLPGRTGTAHDND